MSEKVTPLRFNRNELAGSFGDIGTDLPLLVGLIAAVHLDAAGVFIVFGFLQIISGLLYRLPMPLQPLKAMAVVAITQKVPAAVLFGGGLAISGTMLLLTITGLLQKLVRWIPHCVVRGIQFGLALSLASLALRNYIPAQGAEGWIMAAAAFVLLLALDGNRRFPPGLILVLAGLLYAAFTHRDYADIGSAFGLRTVSWHLPAPADILTGLWLLALPQLPLSIANSVIATEQTVRDLFPERKISVRMIGMTYSAFNAIAPLLGGIPVCHGCGGLAGHYAFGARTGGSVIIYGGFYLAIGLFFSASADRLIEIFPQAILGVILAYEALRLMLLVRDTRRDGREFFITCLVALIASLVPHGFLAGTIAGTAIYYLLPNFHKLPQP